MVNKITPTIPFTLPFVEEEQQRIIATTINAKLREIRIIKKPPRVRTFPKISGKSKSDIAKIHRVAMSPSGGSGLAGKVAAC